MICFNERNCNRSATMITLESKNCYQTATKTTFKRKNSKNTFTKTTFKSKKCKNNFTITIPEKENSNRRASIGVLYCTLLLRRKFFFEKENLSLSHLILL